MGQVLARIAMKANEMGLSEAGLSKAAGMSKDGIRNWRRRFDAGDETAGANVSSVSKVATALGVSELWLLHGIEDEASPPPAIAVAGRVGAGAKVYLVDAFAKGQGLYHVACPPQINPHGIVAVEVEGTSMMPTYEPGAVLFYSRETISVPMEAIGRICVCEDESGKAWVKQIKVGSEEGTFSLISLNPEAENMHGIRLKWAAPVRFSLPPEFVKKI
ncbi:S24 family peptidase [Rhodobacter lacus]|uniref:S24 family peptidase n=2 Tax=Rhodobacter lacus TaxID=1641972 RepID=A0ABW5ADI5_9RHOB